jgi:predicted nucleic acid-binding protein
MNALIVDTDIVSYLFKGHPAASLYSADLTGRALVISLMTLAKLERWPLQAQWGDARRERLKEHLTPFAVMPWDRALCTAWAKVMIGARAKGFRIDCADAWIAATAVLYGVPLVTHNRDDYRGVEGLTLICHA